MLFSASEICAQEQEELSNQSRGAGLDGVEGAVAVAGIRVPDLVGLDALRPVLGVVTD